MSKSFRIRRLLLFDSTGSANSFQETVEEKLPHPCEIPGRIQQLGGEALPLHSQGIITLYFIMFAMMFFH